MVVSTDLTQWINVLSWPMNAYKLISLPSGADESRAWFEVPTQSLDEVFCVGINNKKETIRSTIDFKVMDEDTQFKKDTVSVDSEWDKRC